jgi:integrase/recombinase XerC
MANYAARGATPTTLTDREIALVLGYTGRTSRTIRDHLLISLALGTGAREHELLALDRADVLRPDGEVRRRVRLRIFKGHARATERAAARQWLVLPDECRRKLALYLPRVPAGPLFPSRHRGRRLSARQLRELWARVQVGAGLDRHHPFHHLRHTYASNLYDRTRNAILVQRSARHARLETTLIYVSVSDEQQDRAHRQLPC